MKIEAVKWPTEEERQNMTYEEGQQLARDYYNGKYKHLGYKPTFMKWLRYKTGPLFGYLAVGVIILIVYGLINLVLVGGQNLWHAGDKKELQAIETTLKSWDGKIYMYELDIKNETISDGDYYDYTVLIDKYNVKVKEYNELAEKIGTTFYIVPIPGRK